MDNAGAMQDAMMEWVGEWHWLAGVPGVLTLFFVAVIVFALFGLLHDWRRDHDEVTARSRTGTTRRTLRSSG